MQDCIEQRLREMVRVAVRTIRPFAQLWRPSSEARARHPVNKLFKPFGDPSPASFPAEAQESDLDLEGIPGGSQGSKSRGFVHAFTRLGQFLKCAFALLLVIGMVKKCEEEKRGGETIGISPRTRCPQVRKQLHDFRCTSNYNI